MGLRLTSRPLAIRTPVPGSAASLVRASRPTWPQRRTRSGGPTLTGPQTAPAATDVVCSGRASVLIATLSPASARQMPVVSPLTPAPTTRTSMPTTVSFLRWQTRQEVAVSELTGAQARLVDEAAAAAAGSASLSDVAHVVILMQENRSLDHYFGTLSGVRGFSHPRAL